MSMYDLDIIQKVHEKNIRLATTELESYVWTEPPVNEAQRVAVSGVWHPNETGGAYHLSYRFEFLEKKETNRAVTHPTDGPSVVLE